MTDLVTVKTEKGKPLNEVALSAALTTVTPEEKNVLDFYVANKDRIEMNKQTLRDITERAMRAEEAAKINVEVDKKVDTEVARIVKDAIVASEKPVVTPEAPPVASPKKDEVVEYGRTPTPTVPTTPTPVVKK